MALAHFTATIGTSPQLLLTVPGFGKRKVYIANKSSTNIVYIGDASITSADGFPLLAQAATGVQNRLELECFGGDSIFAVSAATTSVVTVLVPGV
jgi:hypothetical protein